MPSGKCLHSYWNFVVFLRNDLEMVDVHEFFHEFLHLYVSAYWSILHINPGLSTGHFLHQWNIIVLKPRIATARQEASRGRMKSWPTMARPFLEIPSIYSNCHWQPLSLPIIFLEFPRLYDTER